jgi:YbbR domain-containing protein
VPDQVVVAGAGSELKNVSDVETEPIEVDGVSESFRLEVPLNYIGRFSSLEKENEVVEVEVTIGPVKPADRKGK